ncbi:FUSC family protein [Labrys miyagiensis]
MISALSSASILKWSASRRSELTLAIRITVAAGLAFAAVKLVGLSQSSWAVITSVIIMQTSLGGSVKAAMDRMAGTLVGAVWGALVSIVISHHSNIETGGAVLIAVGPTALCAALRPSFRVAPITALIVLIPSGSTLTPYAFALERVAEIAIGILVGVAVALVVLPARAHGVLAIAAAKVTDLNADLLVALVAGLTEGQGRPDVAAIQARIRAALRQVDSAVDEAARERKAHLTNVHDVEPVARTLYRVRHDLVIIARVCVRALPDSLAPTLRDPLLGLRDATVALLRSIADAFRRGYVAPDLAGFEASLAAYVGAMDRLRAEGGTRALDSDEVGRIYALRFGFEQLGKDLGELAERAGELAEEE